ncbi:hypothetical protein IQ255_16755 [Pleurocapsales cyanobacterium LEGE 10410]|nr:hypothetical protein [Pleurocapsales cyanobacterium LEGE 10410]
MTTPEDKERELQLRQAQLEAKERELRLRELENDIYREHNSPEPPLYNTRKHHPQENSMQKFGRKIVKFAKFAGFVVAGVAIIKVGFFVGMWITYLVMTGIVAAIGYQIFLKDK